MRMTPMERTFLNSKMLLDTLLLTLKSDLVDGEDSAEAEEDKEAVEEEACIVEESATITK